MKKKRIIIVIMVALIALAAAAVYYKMKTKPGVAQQHSGHNNIGGMNMKDDSGDKGMKGMDMSKEGGDNMEGMNMGAGSDDGGAVLPHDITLHTLLQPTNSFVLSSIPVTGLTQGTQNINMEVLGFTAYNTSTVGSIAARITGRIEKLYVQYRFQKINKGQKIMEIYSPEFLTAQQNLLFLLKNDATNTSLIKAANDRLLLLGFPRDELQQIIRTGKPLYTVTVYSNYTGHIHETAASGMGMGSEPSAAGGAMGASQPQQLTTQELTVKEGMYVEKGQSIFRVYNPNKLWALLNIYPSDFPFIKVGTTAVIKPEGFPNKTFRGTIYFIEPFFRPGSRTVTARVNIPNQQYKLPVGTQLRASIVNSNYKGNWLPREAVLSLGVDKVVFQKATGGFKVQKIQTGVMTEQMVQVVGGINKTDSVAANAQYLVDSESFIKLNDEL